MDGKCVCVAEHRPQNLYVDHHHIDALYAGGPDTPANLITVCRSTHDWTHKILRAFDKAGGVLIRHNGWPRYAYKLAVDGWQRGVARRAGQP